MQGAVAMAVLANALAQVPAPARLLHEALVALVHIPLYKHVALAHIQFLYEHIAVPACNGGREGDDILYGDYTYGHAYDDLSFCLELMHLKCPQRSLPTSTKWLSYSVS